MKSSKRIAHRKEVKKKDKFKAKTKPRHPTKKQTARPTLYHMPECVEKKIKQVRTSREKTNVEENCPR